MLQDGREQENNLYNMQGDQRAEEGQASESINREINENHGRIRCGGMKLRGGVSPEKERGIIRLFAVNYNGMGPKSIDKLRGLGQKSKDKGIDGAMIISADAHWDNRTKNYLETKLKSMHY